MLDENTSPLTYAIIGAMQDIHSDMGPGFLEKSYQDAVEFAFNDRRIPFEREAAIPVAYRNRVLPTVYRADFVCDGKVLVELKAQTAMGAVEHAQIIHYLKASRLPVGLLVNFGEASLVFRRFVGPVYTEQLPI
ncbi:MAG: GxxExxY protein [Halobacteriales archaeon]|nr:GxxExxY protein [Halobacteriales archaeon]